MILKPDGSGGRALDMPAVLDQTIEQARLQQLQPPWDRLRKLGSTYARTLTNAHRT
jgi:hypothetical protein